MTSMARRARRHARALLVAGCCQTRPRRSRARPRAAAVDTAAAPHLDRRAAPSRRRRRRRQPTHAVGGIEPFPVGQLVVHDADLPRSERRPPARRGRRLGRGHLVHGPAERHARLAGPRDRRGPGGATAERCGAARRRHRARRRCVGHRPGPRRDRPGDARRLRGRRLPELRPGRRRTRRVFDPDGILWFTGAAGWIGRARPGDGRRPERTRRHAARARTASPSPRRTTSGSCRSSRATSAGSTRRRATCASSSRRRRTRARAGSGRTRPVGSGSATGTPGMVAVYDPADGVVARVGPAGRRQPGLLDVRRRARRASGRPTSARTRSSGSIPTTETFLSVRVGSGERRGPPDARPAGRGLGRGVGRRPAGRLPLRGRLTRRRRAGPPEARRDSAPAPAGASRRRSRRGSTMTASKLPVASRSEAEHDGRDRREQVPDQEHQRGDRGGVRAVARDVDRERERQREVGADARARAAPSQPRVSREPGGSPGVSAMTGDAGDGQQRGDRELAASRPEPIREDAGPRASTRARCRSGGR